MHQAARGREHMWKIQRSLIRTTGQADKENAGKARNRGRRESEEPRSERGRGRGGTTGKDRPGRRTDRRGDGEGKGSQAGRRRESTQDTRARKHKGKGGGHGEREEEGGAESQRQDKAGRRDTQDQQSGRTSGTNGRFAAILALPCCLCVAIRVRCLYNQIPATGLSKVVRPALARSPWAPACPCPEPWGPVQQPRVPFSQRAGVCVEGESQFPARLCRNPVSHSSLAGFLLAQASGSSDVVNPLLFVPARDLEDFPEHFAPCSSQNTTVLNVHRPARASI